MEVAYSCCALSVSESARWAAYCSSRRRRAAHRAASVRAAAQDAGKDGRGRCTCELEHGGVGRDGGLDAALDELSADVCGGQVVARDTAGDKPMVMTACLAGVLMALVRCRQGDRMPGVPATSPEASEAVAPCTQELASDTITVPARRGPGSSNVTNPGHEDAGLPDCSAAEWVGDRDVGLLAGRVEEVAHRPVALGPRGSVSEPALAPPAAPTLARSKWLRRIRIAATVITPRGSLAGPRRGRPGQAAAVAELRPPEARTTLSRASRRALSISSRSGPRDGSRQARSAARKGNTAPTTRTMESLCQGASAAPPKRDAAEVGRGPRPGTAVSRQGAAGSQDPNSASPSPGSFGRYPCQGHPDPTVPTWMSYLQDLGVVMPDGTTARPALNTKKSILYGLLGLAVITLIFVRVIPQIGSYEDAVTSLKAMTTGSLIWIVLSVLVYLATYGLPFMAATAGLGYWRSQQLNQGAFAISNGVPAGGAFGLGVQYAMLASYGIEPTVSTAAITAVGLWSIFVTLGLPILGVAALRLSGQDGSDSLWPAVLGLLTLTAAILAFAFITHSENAARRVGSIGNRILAPIAPRFLKVRHIDFVTMLFELRQDIAELVARRWIAITGAQSSVSLTQFLIFYVALRGVEGHEHAGTSILVAFGSFAIAQIGLMIPITPGGLGTVDAAMIALLTAIGVGAGEIGRAHV